MEGGSDDLVRGKQQGDVEQRLRPFAGTAVQPLGLAHGMALSERLKRRASAEHGRSSRWPGMRAIRLCSLEGKPGGYQARPARRSLEDAGFLVVALGARMQRDRQTFGRGFQLDVLGRGVGAGQAIEVLEDQLG